ncbi:MAG: L-threonine 3-dehydrogenase [Gammaproteobacteria bacterium]|nr:L-threonine 3-dehydrogenase [Gammaproteobacteria bacterium]
MKALVKSKHAPGIWMENVDMPFVGHNDVLIKIKKTAICGTDIHIYKWDEWAQKNVPIPLTIGHEFVGEIVEMGKEVHGFKIGDRVSGEGHIACGFCRNCRAGRRHVCRKNESIGVTRTGCFAEYLSLPAVNAYPIPKSIPDNQAAILDPLGNAAHTALSFDLVGEDVLITGAGPVGIMAAAIARHAGARHVVITDVNPYRLNLAKTMGASIALNTSESTLTEAMEVLSMREGFDIGLEMSGNPTAFNDMLDHMNHAGKVALLGFLPPETQINWNNIIMKGLHVKGIYGREMFETWYKMISMLQSGLDISPVITQQFNLHAYDKAFETMASGQSGKVIINWE